MVDPFRLAIALVPVSAYVLLLGRDIRPLLLAIADAARGAGEAADVIGRITDAAEKIDTKSSDYFAFGFDPWQS